jgi:hypothetical protein
MSEKECSNLTSVISWCLYLRFRAVCIVNIEIIKVLYYTGRTRIKVDSLIYMLYCKSNKNSCEYSD